MHSKPLKFACHFKMAFLDLGYFSPPPSTCADDDVLCGSGAHHQRGHSDIFENFIIGSNAFQLVISYPHLATLWKASSHDGNERRSKKFAAAEQRPFHHAVDCLPQIMPQLTLQLAKRDLHIQMHCQTLSSKKAASRSEDKAALVLFGKFWETDTIPPLLSLESSLSIEKKVLLTLWGDVWRTEENCYWLLFL